MLYINRSSKTPIYKQIYDSFKEDILTGRYAPQTRLPATRRLAKDLGVSRNTVDLAYQQLVLEGYIVPHACSGFTVEPIAPSTVYQPVKRKDTAEEQQKPKNKIQYDFWYPLLDCSLFPMKTWKKLYCSALSEIGSSKFISYPERHGEPQLQKAIADYLFRSRGVHCAPHQVIISCGIQFNLELLLKLFDPSCCTAAMEEPGYNGVRDLLQANHFRVSPIPVDHDGIVTQHLKDCRASLLYITPSHQFPTGAILPVNRRMEILDWAKQQNAYIIEDDYDSELRYFSNSIPSLQSIDRNDRVIYLGTFSKVLAPGLRISYLVLPPQLLERYRQICGFYLCQVPYTNQLALTEFINSGYLEQHIRRVRHAYSEKQAKFLSAIDRVFGERIHLFSKNAGLHMLADIETTLTSEELIQRAEKVGIRVYSAKFCWSSPATAPEHQLILGYGSIPAQDYEPALRLLYHAWYEI